MRIKSFLVAPAIICLVTSTFSQHLPKKLPLWYVKRGSVGVLGKTIQQDGPNKSFSPHTGLLERGSMAYNDTEEVDDLLESFFTHLKSYISKMHFDAEGFEANAELLRQDLLIREVLVGHITPSNPQLKEKCRFLNQMYQRMLNSIPKLSHFDIAYSPGYSQVYQMVELNVRLLTLFNSKGKLDDGLEAHASWILHFWKYMNFCKSEFKAIDGLSTDMQLIFDDHSNRVANTLRGLLKQVRVENWVFL
ncbi:hypothetical protein JCM33374_g6189 [Metschnikowia sp. JCM 33374]|nr:hypothetical protein JCM33374_g6189 [Metschnikowia sp. JCM 33374]